MTHIIYLCIIAALILYCIHLRKNQNLPLSKAIDDFNDALEDWEEFKTPDGYKLDTELDAMIREPATTHYPSMAMKLKDSGYSTVSIKQLGENAPEVKKKPAKKRPTMSKRKK